MFCKYCGKEISNNSKFCPECGKAVDGVEQFSNAANNMFNNAEEELGSAINDVMNTINGHSNGSNIAPYAGVRLKEDRGLLAYIVLSIITCGIYSYYFIYQMAHDVNIACEGDGEETGGLVAFILLSFITCGIYAYIWYYKLGNRLNSNAPRYGLMFQENGTTVLLWLIFGAFVCGIGPFLAMHILIKNANAICRAYNRAHGI